MTSIFVLQSRDSTEQMLYYFHPLLVDRSWSTLTCENRFTLSMISQNHFYHAGPKFSATREYEQNKPNCTSFVLRSKDGKNVKQDLIAEKSTDSVNC